MRERKRRKQALRRDRHRRTRVKKDMAPKAARSRRRDARTDSATRWSLGRPARNTFESECSEPSRTVVTGEIGDEWGKGWSGVM